MYCLWLNISFKLLNCILFVSHLKSNRSTSNAEEHPAEQSLSFQQVTMAGAQYPVEHFSCSALSLGLVAARGRRPSKTGAPCEGWLLPKPVWFGLGEQEKAVVSWASHEWTLKHEPEHILLCWRPPASVRRYELWYVIADKTVQHFRWQLLLVGCHINSYSSHS